MLIKAMFSYLRIKKKEYNFNIDHPVPHDDEEFGKVSKDYHVIFDAAKDDPLFTPKKRYNIVTDGNQCSSRRLCADEKPFAKKRLLGRPAMKRPSGKLVNVVKKRPAGCQWKVFKKFVKVVKKRPAGVNGKALKKPAHCKYVDKIVSTSASQTHTGGLFASVDMETMTNKGNLVLHVVEMLNSENKGVKEFAIVDMKQSDMIVNEYSHDCSCQFKYEWEKVHKYVKVCKLDGFHWKTHKCDVPRVSSPKFNSQAAEQLWSRLDRLHFMTEYGRANYRYFLKEYFAWRNQFLRLSNNVDAHPSVSRRQVVRHG